MQIHLTEAVNLYNIYPHDPSHKSLKIKENNFFPDLGLLERKPYLMYVCSPNNPTGTVATRVVF